MTTSKPSVSPHGGEARRVRETIEAINDQLERPMPLFHRARLIDLRKQWKDHLAAIAKDPTQ